MASPQLEHGYVRIANELFERIIQADLGRNEVRLMLLIVRLSYGMQSRRTVLTGAIIGEHLGINRGNARKCLDSLIDMRLVYCDRLPVGPNPGVYRINKNWEDWAVGRQEWPELIARNGQFLSQLWIAGRSTSDEQTDQKRSTNMQKKIHKPSKKDPQTDQKRSTSSRETVTSIEVPERLKHEDMKDMKTPPYPQGETGESGGDFSADQTTGNQGHNSPSRPPEKKLAQALQAITGCKPKPVDLRRVREILSKTTPAGWDATSWRRNVSRTWDSILREVVAEVAQGSRLGSVIGVACARTETALGVAAKLPKQEEH